MAWQGACLDLGRSLISPSRRHLIVCSLSMLSWFVNGLCLDSSLAESEILIVLIVA